jgi:hypothetical protein
MLKSEHRLISCESKSTFKAAESEPVNMDIKATAEKDDNQVTKNPTD